MGRNVVMVHGFMRSVSVPGHLCELTSMFTIQQPYNHKECLCAWSLVRVD